MFVHSLRLLILQNDNDTKDYTTFLWVIDMQVQISPNVRWFKNKHKMTSIKVFDILVTIVWYKI